MACMNTPHHDQNHCGASQHASTRWAVLTAAALMLTSTSAVDTATATSSKTRPSVSFVLTDTKIVAPKTMLGGIIDVTVDARQSKTRAHHLAFFRRNDGVTMKQVLAAPDSDFDKYVTYQGGNSFVEAGKSTRVTLDLDPGNYMVGDFADGPPIIGETIVTAPAKPGAAPTARGTVTTGPSMAFAIPSGFDASGTWRFTNTDTMPHEALLVRPHAVTGIAELVKWAKAPDKPMPADVIGGFGALGPGKQGWADLGPRPKAGTYFFICMVPGPDGVAHLASGMAKQLTIS